MAYNVLYNIYIGYVNILEDVLKVSKSKPYQACDDDSN